MYLGRFGLPNNIKQFFSYTSSRCLVNWSPVGSRKPCLSLFRSHLVLISLKRRISCSTVSYASDWSNDPDKQDKLPPLEAFTPDLIRNFCIVAHVDHGKSTLADRFLEVTGAIKAGSHDHQVLDRLEVEREVIPVSSFVRKLCIGITVKAQTASLFYELNGVTYLLNLIDTPGHVDFNYEVQRSLTACQGVVLLVDSNQGVQAQTLATFFSAFEAEKTIIPVLNKIDLKNANPDAVALQMKKALDMEPDDILRVSGKIGTGVDELLRTIIQKIPPPTGDITKPFKGLVFDSWYDKRRGVCSMVAVIDGSLAKGQEVTFSSNDKAYETKDIGVLRPDRVSVPQLYAGQVGYIFCGMKTTKEAQIGDTVCRKGHPVDTVIPIRKAKPMVFAGIYPQDQSENESLRGSLDKLLLNDSSVSVALEHSPALGQGWRLGFLGLLHMDVFLQRLEYEHGATCIATVPSVPYRAKLKHAKDIKEHRTDVLTIINPQNMPEASAVLEYSEPWVLGTIISPGEYFGEIMSICMDRRGEQKNTTFLDQTRVLLQFYMPLSEVIVDFFDVLKSKTSGYASFDYDDAGYRKINLIKMDVLLNGRPIEELAMVSPTERARSLSKRVCEKLKDTIPRQQFAVMIQAISGKTILAREDLKALRKDVVGQKIYSHGGRDKQRAQKLLNRQKEGKERMRMIGYGFKFMVSMMPKE